MYEASQGGISAGNYNTYGGVDIRSNRILGVGTGTSLAYGISSTSPGSVVSDNVVSTLRGTNGSAAIYVSGNLSLVARNQLADIGTQDASNAVYVYRCMSNYVKFRDNIGYVNSSNSQPNVNSSCPNGQFSGNF